MRKALLLMASVAILALGAVADAQGAGGLDPGFGDGGTVVLPKQIEETWDAVQLPDGRIVIPGREEMVALLPTGEIDPSFGTAGFAPLALPPGATQAGITDLAADSRGRLIVVGNCSFRSPGEDGKDEFRQVALVERFNADGHLDPEFGDGGFATSDFGVPPPEQGGPPSVLVRYASLDHGDRIVLSAQRLAGDYFYKGFLLNRYEAFVARLKPEGEVDASFASGGVLPLPDTETLGRATVDGQDGFYLQAFPRAGATLIHLGADGSADSGFGQDGGRPLPNGTGGPVILDGSGRLLLYGYLQGWKEHRLANGIVIKRLLPNGALDRSFGHGGALSFRMPRLYTARIALDEQGRILVGAALKKQTKKGRRPALPAGFALARLRPGGKLDSTFGRNGTIAISIKHSVESNIESLTIMGNAATLGGSWCGKGRCGHSLTRFEFHRD